MAYPYYGYQYPNYQQTYQQQIPMNQNQNQDERIWVQGESAAMSYLVAPNGFVRLWDSTSPVFYEKRADQSGRPYMETFEYSRKGSQQPSRDVPVSTGADYGPQIDSIEKRLEALEKAVKHDE